MNIRHQHRNTLVALVATVAMLAAALAGTAWGDSHGPYEPEILAGADRYETAAMVSYRNASGDGYHTIYIANGETTDAMAVGTSAQPGSALLLVRQDEVPEATADALCRLSHAYLVFVGGDAAISPEVRDQVQSLTVNYASETGGDACADR